MLNFRAIESQVEELREKARVPGVSLAIVYGNEVMYARGFGATSVEDGGLPVTPQTLFRIGSTTKPLTGTAIMRLVEQGSLDLDRPVREYIPWFTVSDMSVVDRITLRRLMSHTAGLPTDAEHFGRRDPEGLEDGVRTMIPRLKMVAPPGKVWNYSNPGLNVAGYLAEVASGIPYARLMQETVFDPLEMHRTTFDTTVAMTYPLAQSHDLSPDGKLSVQHRFADNVAHYPAGFCMSTVLDLANFAIMLMSNGRFHNKQVLKPESVAAMETKEAELYLPGGTAYGLCLGIDHYKGALKVGHDGGISTFGCRFDMFPEHGLAVIVIANRVSAELMPALVAVQNSIVDGLLHLKEPAPSQPVAPDPSLQVASVGEYIGGMVGLARLELGDGNFTLDLNGIVLPLESLRRDLYVGQAAGKPPVSVGLVPEPSGPTQYVIVNGGVCRRFERDQSFVPDKSQWTRYVGTYGEGAFLRLEVLLQDGDLYARAAAVGMEGVFRELKPGLFVGPIGTLEFESDEAGKVTGVTVGGGTTLRRA